MIMQHPATVTALALVCVFGGSPLAFGQPAATETKQRSNVPEGINDGFLDPELDPEEWMERFEVESREVYASRKAILKALALKANDKVADVGAGTGLFLRPFSEQVGPNGKVFAIDISPRLIDHMQGRVKHDRLTNVDVVQSTEDSVTLPAGSVDVVFTCDTYHHFEYHLEMLRSIHRSLRPGGRLIVVDFERIPGESRDWILGHVRAGKRQVQREIEASGFRLVREHAIDGFEENYFLQFERE